MLTLACLLLPNFVGGFPKKKNFAFLKKCLGLRSILTLVLEDYPLANSEFNRMHNIKLLQFGVPGNKVRPCSYGSSAVVIVVT